MVIPCYVEGGAPPIFFRWGLAQPNIIGVYFGKYNAWTAQFEVPAS